MPPSDLRRLFAIRPFLRFWFARLLGTISAQMLMVAVAWHMYDLTHSPLDLGLVGLLQFVAALALTLPAGHWADRWHRGRILAGCLLAQGVVAALLIFATQGGFASRELIFGLSLMLGAARAFQMPVQQSLTPLLVPPNLLQRAIAVSTSGIQAAIITGPALGGVLYVVGASTVYGTSLLLFLLAGGLAFGLRYQHVPSNHAATLRSMLAGVTYIWQRKVMLGAITLDLFAVLLGGAVALLPIYARDILHTGPEGLGLLRAAPSVGALLVSLLLVYRPLERHVGYKLLSAVTLFGLATVVFGLSRNFALSLLALVVTGAADSISVVTRQTLMQLETPDEIRGRVAAVNSIFIGASNQLGEFESGAVAALIGAVGSVVTGGLGTVLVAGLCFKLFPALAQRDQMRPSGVVK